MIQRMVVFGASGDLTSRLLMPAIAQLAEAGLLPPGFTVVGSANTDWSTEDFRQHIADSLGKHASVLAPATRDAVVQMLSFAPADVTQPAEVSKLIGGDHPDTLVYLALPPGLLPSVLPALAVAKLRATDAVAIEKPFGTDLASARHLNRILRIQLPQPVIFRIDHFLSSELVRRVVTLRFLNRVFEPIWNARPAASSTPSCTHGQPETFPCSNTQPARDHRARRPDTNGHVPAPAHQSSRHQLHQPPFIGSLDAGKVSSPF